MSETDIQKKIDFTLPLSGYKPFYGYNKNLVIKRS